LITAVPLLGVEILAYGSQIDDCDAYSIISQSAGFADHKRGFAHLARAVST
jgi:hypothetical protein